MNLTILNKYDLYDHLVNITSAFQNITKDPSTFLDENEIEAVKNQLNEVLAELQRRRIDQAVITG